MCLFWADDISIGNLKVFGDSLSMDITYSTNRYYIISRILIFETINIIIMVHSYA